MPRSGVAVNAGPGSWRSIVLLLVVVHVAALAYEAWRDSPTANEPGHLIAGISHWELGRLDLYCVNPPLVRLLASVPAVLMDLQVDWSGYQEPPARAEIILGERLFLINGTRALQALLVGRFICIGFSVLGALVCLMWGRDLYGNAGGCLALAIWCLSPDILAHGHLITPDVAAAACGLTAGFAFWRWLKRPTWTASVVTGLVLAIAELTKFTLLVLFPVWWLLFIASTAIAWRSHKRLALRCAQFLVINVTALLVINGFYGFHGSGAPLRDHVNLGLYLDGTDHHDLSVLLSTCVADSRIPVPLPTAYVTGLYLQRMDFHNERPCFLFGKWQRGQGWWYYYLAGWAVKTPVGTLLLALLAVASTLRNANRPLCLIDLFLIVHGVTLFAFVSGQTGLNQHVRYALVAAPFFYVWIGRVVHLFSTRFPRGLQRLCGLCIGWTAISSASCFPHSLSYFNEVVRGPRHGYEYLSHSNTDWGQDLGYFKRWLDAHPTSLPVYLGHAAWIDESVLGIESRPLRKMSPEDTRADGLYALSVNYLQTPAFSDMQLLPLVGRAGYSIQIFEVTGGTQAPQDSSQE